MSSCDTNFIRGRIIKPNVKTFNSLQLCGKMLADKLQHRQLSSFTSSLVSVLRAQCVYDEGHYSNKVKSFWNIIITVKFYLKFLDMKAYTTGLTQLLLYAINAKAYKYV